MKSRTFWAFFDLFGSIRALFRLFWPFRAWFGLLVLVWPFGLSLTFLSLLDLCFAFLAFKNLFGFFGFLGICLAFWALVWHLGLGLAFRSIVWPFRQFALSTLVWPFRPYFGLLGLCITIWAFVWPFWSLFGLLGLWQKVISSKNNWPKGLKTSFGPKHQIRQGEIG